MFVVWFRMKYFYMVVGVFVVFVFIWQFEDLVFCGVFMKIVIIDFRKSGLYCLESICRFWDVIN